MQNCGFLFAGYYCRSCFEIEIREIGFSLLTWQPYFQRVLHYISQNEKESEFSLQHNLISNFEVKI